MPALGDRITYTFLLYKAIYASYWLFAFFPARDKTIFLFSVFRQSEAFKVSFKEHSQHLGYVWDNSSGTRALNTTIARLSCKAKFTFGMQVCKLVQDAKFFCRRNTGLGYSEKEGHTA